MTDDGGHCTDPGVGPASLVGLWIRAGALERIDLRNRFREAIMSTGGFTVGRAEVVFRTFAAGIRLLWSTGTIGDAHRTIGDFVGYYENYERFQAIEVETLVRSARGEITSADQIDPKRRFLISHLFFLFLCVGNELPQHVINELVREGELRALEAGYAIKTPAEEATPDQR